MDGARAVCVVRSESSPCARVEKTESEPCVVGIRVNIQSIDDRRWLRVVTIVSGELEAVAVARFVSKRNESGNTGICRSSVRLRCEKEEMVGQCVCVYVCVCVRARRVRRREILSSTRDVRWPEAGPRLEISCDFIFLARWTAEILRLPKNSFDFYVKLYYTYSIYKNRRASCNIVIISDIRGARIKKLTI